MIIVRLAGGLGNQIFQLGASLLLAQKSGIKKIIFDDKSLSNYESKRENNLSKLFSFNKLDHDIVFKRFFYIKFRIPKLLPLNIPKFPFVSDYNYQTIYQNTNKSFMILDGYFQWCLTQDNFEEEASLLKNILKPYIFESNDNCVIHIRGSDFVKLGWNRVTPKEYYVKAIYIMIKKYQRNKFYVVTDDVEYSRFILEGLKIEYEFASKDTLEDFLFIGSFRYRILSASTFAFWASALGCNENCVVIAPKYWRPNIKRKIFLPNEVSIDF